MGFALALAARFLSQRPASALLIGEGFAAGGVGRALWAGSRRARACRTYLSVRDNAPDPALAFWAMEEALKCGAPAAVVGEIWNLKGYSLAASRRLLLAARKGRTPALLILASAYGQAERLSSAAETRFEDRRPRRASENPGGRPAGPARAVRLRGAAPSRRALPAPGLSATRSLARRQTGVLTDPMDRVGRDQRSRRYRLSTPSASSVWNGEARTTFSRNWLLAIRRFLSLWLPRLATDRARRLNGVDKRTPLAAVAKANNAERLVCVDAEAARLGLTIGLSLADARARHPNLVAVEAAPGGRGAAARAPLRLELALHPARRARSGRDGLMLDISGVAHLFGAEEGLGVDCRARLAAQGVSVAAGIGGNPRAAWALARFSRVEGRARAVERQGVRQALPRSAARRARPRRGNRGRHGAGGLAAPSATSAMRPGATQRGCGSASVGPARRAQGPRALLDHAALCATDLCAERRFASPVQTVEAIEATLRKLADDLVVLLERQAKGARRIGLELHRVDGDVRRIRVGASRPLNEARAIVRLIAERLASRDEEPIDAGYGVDLMRLACLAAEPLAPSQAELERAHEAERARALAELLDRLSARLGARAVTRRELIEAHLPEQAEAAAPATLGQARTRGENRHCEERSDEAIQRNTEPTTVSGLLRYRPSQTGVSRRPDSQ